MEDMNAGYRAGRVMLPLCDRTVTTDISGDFSLPDYQPEIKRLLRIRASVLPAGKYCGINEIDVNGGINYFVLYTGNDDKLYCAPLSTEYSFSVPLDGGDFSSEDMLCLCNTEVDSATGRVTAPRRLNIKSRLKSNVKAYADTTPGGAYDSDSLTPGSIERLIGSLDSCRILSAIGEPLQLADDIIPDIRNGNMRVVCAEGEVFVSGTGAVQGGVTCRGELNLKLMLSPVYDEQEEQEQAVVSADTLPTVITRKIPFSQTIEIDGADVGYDSYAYGSCSELSVEIDEGHIHVEAGVILEVTAQKNETVSYVKDMYSTRHSCDCKYKDISTESAVRCINGNFTQSDSLPLSESGIDPAARIIDVSGDAVIEGATVDEERCVITGKSRYHLILCRDGEYSFAEIELPFRYETEGAPSGSVCHGTVTVMTCRARMDGERVGIDAELAPALRIFKKQNITMLTDAEFKDGGADEALTRRRGEYVVCFPSDEDTLWSIAKKYHSPMATLSVANSLSGTASPDSRESIEGIRYLIV